MDNKTLLAQEFMSTLLQFRKIIFHSNSNQKLRQSEFLLLFNLSCCDENNSNGMKVSDLSNKLGVTPAAVTHMINSLEKEEYVERMNDLRDRRIVLVRTTEKGNELIKSMTSIVFENMKDLIGFLGEADTKEFIRILSKAVGFINEETEKWEVNLKL
jgi:DNA-binding MarR family transcriptional regulator